MFVNEPNIHKDISIYRFVCVRFTVFVKIAY